jgi:hypothetical protein
MIFNQSIIKIIELEDELYRQYDPALSIEFFHFFSRYRTSILFLSRIILYRESPFPVSALIFSFNTLDRNNYTQIKFLKEY